MKKKYQWLLFDADNTLFDFDGAAKLAFQDTLKAFDIAYHPHYINLYQSINNIVWAAYENGQLKSKVLRTKRFEMFLKEIGKDGSADKMNVFYLNSLIINSSLIKGARNLLNKLYQNYKLVLITNGLKEVQRPRLAQTGLTKYFEAIIVSDEIGVGKPQKGFFDYTFEQIKHPPKERVLVIGDNIHSDIKGGIDYGLDTCWYNPFGRQNESSLLPTFEIKKLDEIVERFLKIE